MKGPQGYCSEVFFIIARRCAVRYAGCGTTRLREVNVPRSYRTRAPAHPRALLTDHDPRAYCGPVTNTSRAYFYGFFYYGFPLAGRDWRRTRE